MPKKIKEEMQKDEELEESSIESIDTEKESSLDCESSEDEAKFNCDEDEINASITDLKNNNSLSEILQIKKELLQIYLINLILYKQLDEETKKYSPIKEKLIKISILLEKIATCETKIEIINNDKRVAPYSIVKNKGIMKSRRKEEGNPRINNKRKADNMFEKAKFVEDRNINVKRTKGKKYK